MARLNVLIACERSQVVCSAFRALGHLAYSCDIFPSYGDHPEWHFQCDVREVMYSSQWDLIIAHPPCTYMSKAGAQLMYPGGKLDFTRLCAALDARDFFMLFYDVKCPLCIENPVPLKVVGLPQPSQYIQPYWFGEKYSKKTLLWLRDLPPLWPTCIMANHTDYTTHKFGSKLRSKTFPGVAQAMAEQWSEYLCENMV